MALDGGRLTQGPGGAVGLLAGGEGDEGGATGFGPEHLGEVAKLTRLAADIFRRVAFGGAGGCMR